MTPQVEKINRMGNSLKSVAVLMDNDAIDASAVASTLGNISGQLLEIQLEVSEDLEPESPRFTDGGDDAGHHTTGA